MLQRLEERWRSGGGKVKMAEETVNQRKSPIMNFGRITKETQKTMERRPWRWDPVEAEGD